MHRRRLPIYAASIVFLSLAGNLTIASSAGAQTPTTWPNISGEWYRDGDHKKIDTITQNGKALELLNERTPRERAQGEFTSQTTFVAHWRDHPDDIGTLSDNNHTITWSDGAVWKR